MVGKVRFMAVATAVDGAAHGWGAAVEDGPRSLAVAARDVVPMGTRVNLPVIGKALSKVDAHARITACLLVFGR